MALPAQLARPEHCFEVDERRGRTKARALDPASVLALTWPPREAGSRRRRSAQ
ncbi:MAG: hypothetical protein R3E68_00700 [Burkholderiaceae bacterium]